MEHQVGESTQPQPHLIGRQRVIVVAAAAVAVAGGGEGRRRLRSRRERPGLVEEISRDGLPRSRLGAGGGGAAVSQPQQEGDVDGAAAWQQRQRGAHGA